MSRLTWTYTIEDFWLRRGKNLQDKRMVRGSIQCVDPAICPVFFWTWKVNTVNHHKHNQFKKIYQFTVHKSYIYIYIYNRWSRNKYYLCSLYSSLFQHDQQMSPNQWHHTQSCWLFFPTLTCNKHKQQKANQLCYVMFWVNTKIIRIHWSAYKEYMNNITKQNVLIYLQIKTVKTVNHTHLR